MNQEVSLLHFIREITDSDKEFLAVIEEMNRWIEDEEEYQRVVSMPHNIGRFNFTRDEYKQALTLCSQAIQNTKPNKYNGQDRNIPWDRASQNSCDHLLFYETKSVDSQN